MKKYKSTPIRHTPLTGHPATELSSSDDITVKAMVSPEATDQSIDLDSEKAIEIEPIIAEETSFESAPKPKKRLWSQISREVKEDIQTIQKDKKPVLEMKREPMNNVETKIKEPNAVISKMMSITGNIELETSLLLAGKVVGNIECKDTVEVYPSGNVEGNISAVSIMLSGGEVKGNISCTGTLETDSETVINGDISAQVIIMRGKVTGQVKATESVSMSSTAVVKGDLTSAAISVERGAVLEGKYTVTA